MKQVSELLGELNYVDQLSSYLSNILDTSINLNKELFDNTETESSFKDCKLLNSSIAHAIDYQYEVNRGRNPIYKFNKVSYNKQFNKFDLVITTDSASFYALDKYDFIGIKEYDKVELVLANKVKTKKFKVSDITKNYIFITDTLISNDIMIKVNGEEVDLVTLTLPDYGLLILNSRVDPETNSYKKVYDIGDEVVVKYIELINDNPTVNFDVDGFKFEDYEISPRVEPETVQIHDYALLNYISNLEFFSNNDIKLIIKNYFYERFKSYKCTIRTIPITNCYNITIPKTSNISDLVIKDMAGHDITGSFNFDRFNEIVNLGDGTPSPKPDFEEYIEGLNAPLSMLVKYEGSSEAPTPIIYGLQNSSFKYTPKMVDGNLLAFVIYYKPRTKITSDGEKVLDYLSIDEYARFTIRFNARVYTHQAILCKFISAESVEVPLKLTINYEGNYNNIVQLVSNALEKISDTIGESVSKESIISKLSAIDGVKSITDNGTDYPSIGSTQYPTFNKEGIVYESTKFET